jgi:hypothetical protein
LLPPLSRRLSSQLGLWLCLPGLALVPAPAGRRRQLLALVAGLAILLLCLGCGGTPGDSPASIAGVANGKSYSINVTAASSSASASVPVKLQVTN